MSDLQQALKKAQEDAEIKKRDDTVEILIRVMSAAYDKSITYSNLIMIGGFASFFAVWVNFYEDNKTTPMTLAGVLMLISVTVFIVWELYKMIFYSSNLRALHKITEESNPQAFHEKLAKHELEEKKRNLTQLRLWVFVLIVTIIPGLSAAGILIYSIASKIISNLA